MNRFLVILSIVIGFPFNAFSGYSNANLQTATDGTIEAIPLEATAVEAPPSIQIKTYAPGTFSIYRKLPLETAWGVPVATGVTLAAGGTWSDTTVTLGAMYEYKFANTAGTMYNTVYPTGYILAGLKADQTAPKGRMAIVVASDIFSRVPAEYAQYKADLVADGWTVHEIPCPTGSYSGVGAGAIATVKVNAGGTGFGATGNAILTNAAGKKAQAKLTTSGGALTAVAVVTSPGNSGGAGFAVGDALTILGGSTIGSGASLTGHIDWSQATLGYAYPVTGGSGYTNNQAVTLTGNTSHKTAQGKLNVSGGTVSSITILSSETGFIATEALTMSGSTTGSGLGNLAAYVGTGSTLTYVYINAPGSGYINGDLATLTGNISGKTAQVQLAVTAAGVISSVSIRSSQTGFAQGEKLTLSGVSAGSGVGLFSSTLYGPLQTITVNAGGSGYANGTIATLNSGNSTAQGTLTVAGGAITGITVTSGGTGFNEGASLFLTDLQSSATGYDIAVLTVDNSGAGRGVVISAGGSGYRDNDSVTITGVTSGVTVTGSIIAPGGVITGVSAVLPNTFVSGESLTISPTAGGSGVTATAGASLVPNHLLIRSAIQAVYNTYPGELKNVVMVGRVPVCRSGQSDYSGPDGHGNEAPYAADAFYADMDGVVGVDWTDTNNNLGTTPLFKNNLSGDNQYDQESMWEVGNGMAELGFGRIDFSNALCKQETESLRSYFNKLHRYKTASPDFLPGRRACDRYGFGAVRETGIMALPSIVGMANIDVITSASLPSVDGGDDADAAYSADHGPYLFYFKGASVPGNGTGGRAVLWTGMQSHYGFWYIETAGGTWDTMQSQLAEDNFALSWTWDIFGTRYLYHRMGMGFDTGDMMKQSINNTPPTGTYSYKYTGTILSACSGGFFMNHMGDPALRLFMFAAPTRLNVVKNGANPTLTWTSSTDPSVVGYHVYRKPVGNGSYTRLTPSPQPGTTYTDSSVSSDAYTYMVRAVRLETTGSGTYYNASLGIEQSVDLSNPPAALSITDTSLPDAYWNTPYLQKLAAQGGVPQYTWLLAAGALPPGLSLSPFGVISGTPTAAGVFTFTVQAGDQEGVTAQKTLSIITNSNGITVLTPEATTYTSSSSPSSSYGTAETNAISASTSTASETFQRYNLSGLNLNNGFIKARLQLYVTTNTAANLYALVQGKLIADAQDGWVENGRSVPFETAYANNGANKIRITSYGHGFVTGNQVTIAGFTPDTPNDLWTITRVDDDHFDIPVTYSSSYVVDPALAYATAASLNYSTRPTVYNPNVPTLSVDRFPMGEGILEMDVTPFVTETLAHDPAKLMSLRLFTTSTSTVWIGSRRGYGVVKPRLIIEASDAPAINVSSPLANPAYVYAGSGLKISASVTPIPARAGSLSLLWSKISGPGTVTFSSLQVDSPSVTFSAAGTYVLRLAASDGILQSNRDLTVIVMPSLAGISPATGPGDNLFVRLPLDESAGTTATDLSGATPAKTGTLKNFGATGNPTWSASGGAVGGALVFNGDRQYVEIPDSAASPYLDGMQKLSLSFWIYTNSSDANSHAIAVKRASATTTTTNSYSVHLDSSRRIVATLWNRPALTGTAALPVGQWCHVAVVFDGALSTNNLQIYLNGIPDKFGTITGLTNNIIPHFTSNLRIGTWFSAATNVSTQLSLNGMVDEFRLYSRVLSIPEIQDLALGHPANTGPVIKLGASAVNGSAGQPFALNATVSDDSLPGPLQTAWSKVGGPGSVSFADPIATSTSATALTGGSYTLRLTASDGSIVTFGDVAANITGDPYQQWLQANNLPSDGSGDGAPAAMPLSDGVPNVIKYALGLNLDVRGYGDRLTTGSAADSGQDYLVLAYTRPEPAPAGITYTVKTCSDLTAWSAEETLQLGSTVSQDGLWRTTTVRDTQPIGGVEQARYIHLEIDAP